jgi:ABC-type transporter Mla subunit MlaD
MKIDDKNIGYGVLLAGLLILIFLLFYIYFTAFYGHYEIQVAFPNLGILAIDDPAKIHGKQVGKVKSIAWVNRRPLVTLVLFGPVDLRADYGINERDRGLMGDREIEINPGNAESKTDQKNVLRGNYISGIAEAIGLTTELEKKITELQDLIAGMAGKKGQDPSFPKVFGGIIDTVDIISQKLETFMAKIERPIQTQVAKVQTISAEARQLSGSMVKNGGALLDLADTLSARIDFLLNHIQPALSQAEKLTDSFKADSTFVGRVLQPVSFLDTLELNLKNLQNELEEIRRHGRLNINLF